MPLINLFTTMYFYFGFLNFYANAIVFVNKNMYISEEIWSCFYLNCLLLAIRFAQNMHKKQSKLNSM